MLNTLLSKIESTNSDLDLSKMYTKADAYTRDHFGIYEPIILTDEGFKIGEAEEELVNEIVKEQGFTNMNDFFNAMNEHHKKLLDEYAKEILDSNF